MSGRVQPFSRRRFLVGTATAGAAAAAPTAGAAAAALTALPPPAPHRTDWPRSSGAGIAGLTAAHELVDRGYSVTVYERKALAARPVPFQCPIRTPHHCRRTRIPVLSRLLPQCHRHHATNPVPGQLQRRMAELDPGEVVSSLRTRPCRSNRAAAVSDPDAAQPRHTQGLHRIDDDRVPDAFRLPLYEAG